MIKKLYAGEYFFYDVDVEYTPEPNDKNEICQAGWFTLAEIKTFKYNADISNFISKVGSGKLVGERFQ